MSFNVGDKSQKHCGQDESDGRQFFSDYQSYKQSAEAGEQAFDCDDFIRAFIGNALYNLIFPLDKFGLLR